MWTKVADAVDDIDKYRANRQNEIVEVAMELLGACEYALGVLESIPKEYAEAIADVLDEAIDTGRLENVINKARGVFPKGE
jgi:hypothetical protein